MIYSLRHVLIAASLVVAPVFAANQEYILTCEQALIDQVAADVAQAGYTIRLRSKDGVTMLVVGPRNIRLLRRIFGVRSVEKNERVGPPQ